MKKLEDLKSEILNGNIQRFYVFYGEDYGIRKHYIDKLATFFNRREFLDSCEDVSSKTITVSLFKTTTLYVIYGDLSFARQNKNQIQTFINRLKDDTVVLVLEDEQPSTTLFKEFSQYITYFPVVQKNIAVEFVDSELRLSQESKEELAFNCNNNYNNILMESDKVRSYSEARDISEQNAYNALESTNQLLFEYPEYDSGIFMNYVLCENYNDISYWVKLIKSKYIDKFYTTLMFIFTDYLIAYLVRKYGKWDGSSRAYNYGLSWGRAKVIRDLPLLQQSDYYLQCAFRVSEIDVKIKNGRLLREDVIDEFISQVI